jgi:DNA polymerase III subunit delta'
MNFKTVIGQEAVKKILTRSADWSQLPNSYLFAGPEGVGKWAAALALTAYLNCLNKSDGDSCGVCPRCKQIASLQFPDLHIAVPTPPSKTDKEELENYWEILGEKIAEPYSLIAGRRQMSIPVSTVREMKRNLAQRPSAGGQRVVIIEQMDRMLTNSADALLKLIEEPPVRTLIIITTSRPERLLPTIISRCRRIRFPLLPEKLVRAYLIDRYEQSDTGAALLARLAQGSLGRAIYLSDDENHQDREVAKLLFKGLFVSDPAELVAEGSDLLPLGDRFRFNRIIRVWQGFIRDLITLRCGAPTGQLINIDFTAELERLAGRPMTDKRLLSLPRQLGAVAEDVDLNVDLKSAAGALLITMHNAVRS